MAVNTLLIIWGLWPVPSAVTPSRKRTALSILALLGLRVLFSALSDLLTLGWLRHTVKLMAALPFLMLWKGLGFVRALHAFFYLWLSFTAADNVFATPTLTGIIGGVFPFTESSQLNYVLGTVLATLLHFAIITAVTRLVSMRDIPQVGARRMLLIGFIIICELYITYTLRTLEDVHLPQLTVYLSVLQLFILGGLIVFEKYLASSARAHRMELEQVVGEARLSAAQARLASEGEMRQLHHDIKNHLLAVMRLKDHPEGIERYISGLLERFSSYESLPRTGNAILDGLLADKAADAGAGISFRTHLNMSRCTYLDGIDVCTIFGNALDNAIEACRQLDTGAVIELTDRVAGGYNIVTISNPYNGVLTRSGGDIVTSKPDAAAHGYGLAGIRRTMEKYGGEMTADTDDKDIFRLHLFFPVKLSSNGKDSAGR